VGGKMGSGGYRMASPLNLFVTQAEAAEICSQIVRIFRDHGFRELRTKARLAFLIDDWGVEKFRKELERRAGRPLLTAGRDERAEKHVDHVGVYRQKQPGLNYVGLAVPVGRVTGEQLLEIADLAEKYGSGLIRLTIGQNVIIPNVPDALIGALTAEPLLRELRYDPSEIMRGLVSCTGGLCHFALIKPSNRRSRPHWLGGTWKNQTHIDSLVRLPGRLQQPSGSGHRPHRQEHQGKRTGGRSGGRLPRRLERPGGKSSDQNYGRCSLCGACPNAVWTDSPRRFQSDAAAAPKNSPNDKHQWRTSPGEERTGATDDRSKDIAEGLAKLVRTGGEEMAIFRSDGQLYGIKHLPTKADSCAMGGSTVAGRLPAARLQINLKPEPLDGPKAKVKVFKLVSQEDQFILEGNIVAKRAERRK
jgi:hypothetical protein